MTLVRKGIRRQADIPLGQFLIRSKVCKVCKCGFSGGLPMAKARELMKAAA